MPLAITEISEQPRQHREGQARYGRKDWIARWASAKKGPG